METRRKQSDPSPCRQGTTATETAEWQTGTVSKLDQFTASRPRLLGLAYRLLGEMAEAEDAVQDAYLRWAKSDGVEVPEAWLTKVVTNLCLTRLTSARARREKYIGSWLPEPVVIEDGALGPLDQVEQRETLSYGFLLLLERLTPPERATFVLREAFGHSHREIADFLDIDEPHARQLYHRARRHAEEPRKRFNVLSEQVEEFLSRFTAATTEGDLAGLEQLLTADVTLWGDGGGKAAAALRPVIGRDKVMRYLKGLTRQQRLAAITFELGTANGSPAMLAFEEGHLTGVIMLEFTDDRISALHATLNPEKLAFISAQLM